MGFADDAEAAAAQDIGGEAEIYDVEEVEEFAAKFDVAKFRGAAVPDGGVFDHREVVVVVAGGAKGVAAEGAEAALVRSGAARDVNRNIEKRGVVCAQSEIVLADFAAG